MRMLGGGMRCKTPLFYLLDSPPKVHHLVGRASNKELNADDRSILFVLFSVLNI